MVGQETSRVPFPLTLFFEHGGKWLGLPLLGHELLFLWWKQCRPLLLEQSSAPDLHEASGLSVWWPLVSPFPKHS